MKIVSIIGARPQFIKAATVTREIGKHDDVEEILVHTGQHYDKNMSDVFFEELQIPQPKYNLEVGSGTHGAQTAKMLMKIEEVLLQEKPDWVLVYGDTNSTIAGALAAVKLHIPVAHVEACLRSFNRKMPEEINRITTDHASSLLFTATKKSIMQSAKEGLEEKTVFSGDVMYDSILFYKEFLKNNPDSHSVEGIPEKFYLATVHRPQNTDNPERMKSIFSAFEQLKHPVVLPLHPRTRKIVNEMGLNGDNIVIIPPVSYLEMIKLLNDCEKVLTDSGGLQKEAYFMQKQCITMRDETEWVDTLHNNWNTITSADEERILAAIYSEITDYKQVNEFGNGNAAGIIVNTLKNSNVTL